MVELARTLLPLCAAVDTALSPLPVGLPQGVLCTSFCGMHAVPLKTLSSVAGATSTAFDSNA
jgi:hypothetical protein